MKKQWVIVCLVFVGVVVVGGLWAWPKVALRQDEINVNMRSEFVEGQVAGIFKNQHIVVPNDEIKTSLDNEISAQENKKTVNKKIEIDLSRQKIYAYENGTKVWDFLISSGTWNRTPTGEFKIWSKIKSQKMSGGVKELGTYYYLPNVPFNMFFYNDKVPKQVGYAVHGAYWHNQFGKPMSHGCINMSPKEAKLMFEWADTDTPIIIYGKMPLVRLPWTTI